MFISGSLTFFPHKYSHLSLDRTVYSALEAIEAIEAKLEAIERGHNVRE